MKKFKNTSDGLVDVPALGLVDVEPGQTVEVADPAVSDGMDGSDIWEHIPDPKRSKAAKKAAATRADDTTTSSTAPEKEQ